MPSTSQLERASVSQPYPGLVNHGATCYYNSIFQVLARIPEVRERLSRFTEFKLVFDSLLSPRQDPVDPILLIEALGTSGSQLYSQQDAMEKLQQLLNIAEFGINEFFLSVWQHQGSEQLDSINVLSLPMNGSVIETLIEFTSQLVAPSPIMTVHLQRSNTIMKDSSRMDYPDKLEIVTLSGDRVYYRLESIVVHEGTISVETGHYFVLCRTPEGWMAFNDELVYPDAIENYYGGDDYESQAYLLFYVMQS